VQVKRKRGGSPVINGIKRRGKPVHKEHGMLASQVNLYPRQ